MVAGNKNSPVAGGGDEDHGDGGCVLPEDQVFETLTRVSLDDLAACRMVSSRWRRLTYEPGFARLHCRRAGIVSGYFVQGITRNRYRADFVSLHHHHHSPSSSPQEETEISLGFLPSAHERVEAVAAHRGLLCCVEADTRRPPCYYVHWLRWPDRRTGKQDVFALDMKTDTWRLIALPPEVEEEDRCWARKVIVAVEGRLCDHHGGPDGGGVGDGQLRAREVGEEDTAELEGLPSHGGRPRGCTQRSLLL